MRRRIIMVLIITFLILPYKVKAAECDASDIKRLGELSKVITYQYDYYGAKEVGTDNQTYEIYFENLGSDFFIAVDDNGNRISFDKDGEREKVQSGKKLFSVYSSKCNVTVGYINIDLPKFNVFSYSEFCEEHENLAVCGEWYQDELKDDDLEKIIAKYEENDSDLVLSLVDFVKSYYYLIIPVFVILIMLIVLLIKNKIKSSKLE